MVVTPTGAIMDDTNGGFIPDHVVDDEYVVVPMENAFPEGGIVEEYTI